MDIFDFALYAGYLLFIVALLSGVILPLVKSLDNPKSLLKSGIGVGALLAIFLVAFLVSKGDVSAVAQKFEITATGSKVIGATLTTVYILGIGSIVAIIYTEIAKIIK